MEVRRCIVDNRPRERRAKCWIPVQREILVGHPRIQEQETDRRVSSAEPWLGDKILENVQGRV